MIAARLWIAGLLLGCHTTQAVVSPSPGQACAPAIPLLAAQHTPNVTRIYLASLTLSGESVQVGAPVLATSRQGFVNQPAFSADGRGLYFTWRPEGSQADIWFRDLRSGAEHPVTCTSEEEYIASPTPDGTGLTVVRVERDLARKLVVLGLDGAARRVLFPGVTTVGAYRWADDRTVALLVSNPDGSSALMLGDAPTGKVRTVARQVGGALAKIPGTRGLSYVDQSDEHQARLMSVDLATGATAVLLPLPAGVDQVAWLPDRTMLAGSGMRILRASAAAPEWREVADLAGKIDGTVSRLAISGDRRRVAIVVRIEG